MKPDKWRSKLLRRAWSTIWELAEAETENERFYRFHVEASFDGQTERRLNREKYEARRAYLDRKIRQCELVIEKLGGSES